jgi:glutathione S-transferase
MTLTLLYQTHSPFARKALVFAHEASLADRIEVVHHETSPTLRNDAVFAQNPLGKVPVLLREGRAPIFDSDVICAYLDTLHDQPPLIPKDGESRWQALGMQAVAQGIAEAGIALRWETVRRPKALRYRPLQDGYTAKLLTSYDWLEATLDPGAPLHVGHIGLATAYPHGSTPSPSAPRCAPPRFRARPRMGRARGDPPRGGAALSRV